MTHEEIEFELERIASLVSRLAYEAQEIKSAFCTEGFLSTSDHKYLSDIGERLLNVLEQGIHDLELAAEGYNSLYIKSPQI